MLTHTYLCTHLHKIININEEMSVHIYVYVCVYIHKYFDLSIPQLFVHNCFSWIDKHMYVCTHVHMCMCIYIWICICIHLCTYVCICSYVCLYYLSDRAFIRYKYSYICMCVCMQVHMVYVHAYICMNIDSRWNWFLVLYLQCSKTHVRVSSVVMSLLYLYIHMQFCIQYF